MKHWSNKQRENCREDRSQECVCCYRTCPKPLKSVDEIIQGGLEDGEESKTHADESNARCKPEYALIRCPSEHKKTSCEEDSPDHHWEETGFWYGSIIVRFKSSSVQSVVPNIVKRRHGKGYNKMLTLYLHLLLKSFRGECRETGAGK
jgi:hypothetical protein